jgi:hypothetical protein
MLGSRGHVLVGAVLKGALVGVAAGADEELDAPVLAKLLGAGSGSGNGGSRLRHLDGWECVNEVVFWVELDCVSNRCEERLVTEKLEVLEKKESWRSRGRREGGLI